MEDCWGMLFREKLGIRNIRPLLTGRFEQSSCKVHLFQICPVHNVGKFVSPRNWNILFCEKKKMRLWNMWLSLRIRINGESNTYFYKLNLHLKHTSLKHPQMKRRTRCALLTNERMMITLRRMHLKTNITMWE